MSWPSEVRKQQAEQSELDHTPIANDYAPELPKVAAPLNVGTSQPSRKWEMPADYAPPPEPPSPPPPPKLDIETPEAIGVEISSLYQRVHDGAMTAVEANRRIEILMAKKTIIQVVNHGKRLEAIEEMLNRQREK